MPDNLEREKQTHQNRIEDLEEMLWVTIDKGGLPVKILEKFSNDAIQKLVTKGDLTQGDIVSPMLLILLSMQFSGHGNRICIGNLIL